MNYLSVHIQNVKQVTSTPNMFENA